MGEQELYSYHVFLFPFQWYYTGKEYRDKTFEEKTVLKEFRELLKNTSWKTSNLPHDSRLYYNERNYFYDFVRDILYDEQNRNENKDPEFIAHYQYDIPADTLEYKIKLSSGEEFNLQIDSILLHLYSTGVSVLSFHLNNRSKSQSAPDDILKINQFGRRLYPPFFGMPQNIIGSKEQFLPGGFKESLEITKFAEMPASITIGNWEPEDWKQYEDPTHFKNNPFTIPSFIKNLFPTLPLTTNPKDFNSDIFQIYINPALDERMFVVCWYGNDEIVDEIRDKASFKGLKDSSGKFEYLKNEWLYKYLFVDVKNATCQNENMLNKQMKSHICARWLNYGTLFGTTRYSFICVTQNLDSLKSGYSAFLLNHVQTMYYKMVELSLVQRACLLRFADEVTEISSMMKKDDKFLAKRVSNLYKQYIRFVNKIYFREVTSQEQGIELYDLIQEHMRIDRDVKDLDNEIGELHAYVMMVEETKRNRNLELLTKLGAAFIVPTFIAGFLGMNVFQEGNTQELSKYDLIGIFLLMIIAPIILFILLGTKKSINLTKTIWIGIIIFFIMCIIITWVTNVN